MNRLLSVTVNNRPGVLHRITALFLRKGFNIQTMTIGALDSSDRSRMTIVLGDADDATIEQVTKQLHKQIDVLKVSDWTQQPVLVREVALIQVSSPLSKRAQLAAVIEPFRARIVDAGRETAMVEVVGGPDKVDALIDLLRPLGIIELARTGVTALTRDTRTGTDAGKRVKTTTLPI